MGYSNAVMADPTGGILTPAQRDFLRGIDLEGMSNPSKSMMRNRIVERIQMSYIKDTPLIASSLTTDDGYNSLSLDRIVDAENREDFLEGLTLQVALVRELSEAADADPEEIIRDGRTRELTTAEDPIKRKARENPESMTLREVSQLSGEVPQELKDHIDETIAEIDKIRPGGNQSKSISHDRSSLTEDEAKQIADDLPEEDRKS